MDLAERMARARRARGLSQAEAAERLNVSRQAISRWETGAGMPTLDNLFQMGKLYQVSLDELIYGVRPETPPERTAEPEQAEETKEVEETGAASPERRDRTEGPERAGKRRSALWAAVLALGAAGILATGIWAGIRLTSMEPEEKSIPWTDLQAEQTIEIIEEVELLP